MTLRWDLHAWDDFLYWLDTDKAIARRLRALLKECLRTPTAGTGKPELLQHDFAGCWSRRITDEHRLVYQVGPDFILVLQCRYHYRK